jgi:hypothetical protein
MMKADILLGVFVMDFSIFEKIKTTFIDNLGHGGRRGGQPFRALDSGLKFRLPIVCDVFRDGDDFQCPSPPKR